MPENTTELEHARSEVFDRLSTIDMSGIDSYECLSEVCNAIYPMTLGWTQGACESLRSKLMWLMSPDRPEEANDTEDGSIEPITTELRKSVAEDTLRDGGRWYVIEIEEFNDQCDAIDAIHAYLEAQLATAEAINERQDVEYAALASSMRAEHDEVNHPAHYTHGRTEAIDVIEDSLGRVGFVGYCVGNALKYLIRHRAKGGETDLRKAHWYLDRLVSTLDGDGE